MVSATAPTCTCLPEFETYTTCNFFYSGSSGPNEIIARNFVFKKLIEKLSELILIFSKINMHM